MTVTWIVVAENSRARVFEAEKNDRKIREIKTFSHPESRLHEQDLTSDLPGRSFDSGGQGRHAMESPLDPKEQEASLFAKQVCNFLEISRKNNQFQDLGLIAAPAMLGLLREELDSETKKLLGFEVAKNIVKLPPDEILAHIPESLSH